VLLSWSIFQRRFAGDPSIIGKQVHLDTKPTTVIGVLPSWFTYPDAKFNSGCRMRRPSRTRRATTGTPTTRAWWWHDSSRV